jgi:4-amino-4-deoxy-L-arabinose transferase-like glycosyltransferase
MKLSSKPMYGLILGLCALLGMLLVLYATASGPGVGGDATIYLTSARNLILGKGLGWTEADGSFRLLPYTPPFYPLLLAGIGLFGNMEAGARFLNIVLFDLLVVLIGISFTRFTGQRWFGLMISGLLAASPVLLGVHLWAMSEPLFLFLGFSGLILLLYYLDTSRRWQLILAALLCGLAFLTRYMGAAFIATAGLALFLFGHAEDRRVRLRIGKGELWQALQFGIVAILPIFFWFVVDISLTGTLGSRSGQPASAYWQRFLAIGPALQQIYLFWLVPESVSARIPAAFQLAAWLAPLAALLVLGFVLVRRARSSANSLAQALISPQALRLAGVFVLFTLVYLVVLAVAQVFTYPPITLASRMLSPVHLALLVWLPLILVFAVRLLAPRSHAALGLVGILFMALLATYLLRSALIAREYHSTGIGYNASAWRSSATIAALKQLPPDVALVSNETTAIMYLAGRPAYALQEIYQDKPLAQFTVYGAGNDPAQQVFREKNAALVLFKANLHEDFAMYGDRLDERLAALTKGLYLYTESEDGAIYFNHQPNFTLPGQ